VQWQASHECQGAVLPLVQVDRVEVLSRDVDQYCFIINPSHKRIMHEILYSPRHNLLNHSGTYVALFGIEFRARFDDVCRCFYQLYPLCCHVDLLRPPFYDVSDFILDLLPNVYRISFEHSEILVGFLVYMVLKINIFSPFS